MAGVPFVFGNATTSIPLSNLDADFNTPVTIGNTTVGLGNTVTTLGNVTLTNVTIASGTTNVSANSIVNGTSNVVIASSGGAVNISTNGTQAITVNTSQNVGIGTSSPSTKLDVSGNVRAQNFGNGAIAFQLNDATGTAVNQYIDIDLSKGAGAYSYYKLNMNGYPIMTWGESLSAYAGNLSLNSPNGATILNTSSTERMRIDSSGNLLVGTTSSSSSGITIGKQYGGVNLSGGGGSWANWGGGYGLFPYSNVGLGIGTGANIGFVNGTGTQIASINGATGVYTPLSDKNQKKDFELSTVGLDAVMELKPTLYRMINEDESTPKQLWFIAQDVEPIIPQAFIKNVISGKNTPEEVSFIGLDERPIIAALTKAIQEQQALIESLTTRLTALENK